MQVADLLLTITEKNLFSVFIYKLYPSCSSQKSIKGKSALLG